MSSPFREPGRTLRDALVRLPNIHFWVRPEDVQSLSISEDDELYIKIRGQEEQEIWENMTEEDAEEIANFLNEALRGR